MTITELSQRLDEAIACYEQEASVACQYCSDDISGNAFEASYKATAKALSSFKAEILAYLLQD